MGRILFKCPRCSAETEILLETPANMLLLSCSECRCPLMYFSGQVFEIEDAEFKNLQGKQMKAVEGFLKIHRTARRANSEAQINLGARALRASHKAGAPVRTDAIGSGDITDLIIDLETSEDVDDFLKRLG